MPWFMPSGVAGHMWALLLDSCLGVINDILLRLGFINSYVPWFAQRETAMLWHHTGSLAEMRTVLRDDGRFSAQARPAGPVGMIANTSPSYNGIIDPSPKNEEAAWAWIAYWLRLIPRLTSSRKQATSLAQTWLLVTPVFKLIPSTWPQLIPFQTWAHLQGSRAAPAGSKPLSYQLSSERY